jgi:hypothetical protein
VHRNVTARSLHIPSFTGDPLRTRYSIRHIAVLGGDGRRPRVSLSIIRAGIIPRLPVVLLIGIHLQIDPFDKAVFRQHLIIRSKTLIVIIRLNRLKPFRFSVSRWFRAFLSCLAITTAPARSHPSYVQAGRGGVGEQISGCGVRSLYRLALGSLEALDEHEESEQRGDCRDGGAEMAVVKI